MHGRSALQRRSLFSGQEPTRGEPRVSLECGSRKMAARHERSAGLEPWVRLEDWAVARWEFPERGSSEVKRAVRLDGKQAAPTAQMA
jgi:hypothetical protein